MKLSWILIVITKVIHIRFCILQSIAKTLVDMVIYQDVNAPDKILTRPATMWNDDIEIDGKTVKRFELMEEAL